MSSALQVHFDESQLLRLGRQIDNAIRSGITEGVAKAVNIATATAKTGGFQDQTGNLRLHIYGKVEGWNGNWFWGLVHSPEKYSSYVEFGTKPHKIYPKAAFGSYGPLPKGQSHRASGKGPHEHIVGRGIALRWKDAGGEQHFARVVDHPGSPGFFFMRYAEAVARREISKYVQASVRLI